MPTTVKRAILGASVIALALTGLAVSIAPAHATLDSSAMTFCQQGNDAGNLKKRIDMFLPGNAPKLGVLLDMPALEPGDVVRINASGTIGTGGWSGTWGPNGKNELATGWQWPAPGLNKYSLWGYWGRNGAYFRAGTDSGCLDYSTIHHLNPTNPGVGLQGSGPDNLWVGINDENPSDNSGGFNVTIRVYRSFNQAPDGGFEQQPSRSLTWPWMSEGPDYKGVDIALGFAHSGRNNGFIRTSSSNWNALSELATVVPNRPYRLEGFIRTSNNFIAGFFGVRPGASLANPIAEVRFGPASNGYQRFIVDFNPGNNDYVRIFAGYWATGYDTWLQLDDVTLRRL